MGTDRESRPSEITFDSIWNMMKSLNNCVWHPLPESAKEIISAIKEQFIKLEEQITEESITRSLPVVLDDANK